MSISRKIRFEVFKRDGFKCAYCGKSPPQIILEADHIDPKDNGGGDDINNLITACFDCNRGKKNIPLIKVPSTISENLLILQEQENQLKEYRKFVKKIEHRIQKDIDEIDEIYSQAYPEWGFSENFKRISLKVFLRSLSKEKIIDFLEKAIYKFPNDKDTVIRYFCGICWREIKGNDPGYLIKTEWKKLSSSYGKGIGYCKKADIEKIKNIPFSDLQNLMHETLKQRREAYWKYFINLIEAKIAEN